jgi:hypothetical protein
MASASADASTPFFTSTPSKAVTFAFPGAAVRFGDGFGFAAAAAGSVLAASPFAGFASLLPAISGTAAMDSTSRHENNRFNVNIDGLSSFWLNLGTEHGAEPYAILCTNVKAVFGRVVVRFGYYTTTVILSGAVFQA